MDVNNNCTNCPKRKSCTKLCDDAEAYVNQDHVSQSHRVSLSGDRIENYDYPEVSD